MIWLLAALAGPHDRVPYPSGATGGAVCSLRATFDKGEQSRLYVMAACPEVFREAIRATFEAAPLELQDPADEVEMRVSFVVGQRVGLVREVGSAVSDLERPRPGSRVWVPNDFVRIKKLRWPRAPDGLQQPVICRADVDFDAEGNPSAVTVRGCPRAMADATREAVQTARVKPKLWGRDVQLSTQLTFPFNP